MKAEEAESAGVYLTRGHVNTFQSKENCLFRAKDASDSFVAQQIKKAKNRRETVRSVMTVESIKRTRAAATDRGDKWVRMFN